MAQRTDEGIVNRLLSEPLVAQDRDGNA